MNRATVLSNLSGRTAWVIAAALIAVMLLAVGGCGDDDQEADDGATAAVLPRNAFGLLPDDAREFVVIDVEQALTGDAPSDFEDQFDDRWSEPLLESGVDIDDVSAMVVWDAEGSELVIVWGEMDFDDVRDELDDAGLEEDEYRGFELWDGGRGRWSSAAVLESGGYLVLESGRGERVEDVLRGLSRESGLIGHEDESLVTELLEDVGLGWYTRVEIGEGCGGLGVRRCEGVVWSSSEGERNTVSSVWGYAFRDERSADAALDDVEDLFEEIDGYDLEDVVVEGRLVVARGEIDEDEWIADAWSWVLLAAREAAETDASPSGRIAFASDRDGNWGDIRDARGRFWRDEADR